MKRFLMVGMAAAALATATPAWADEGSAPEWSEAVLRLEQQMKPTAFRPSWTAKAKAWRSSVGGWLEFDGESKAILAFEAQVNPKAFKADWAGRRATWVALVQTTTKRSELETALKQLEQALAPGSFKPTWAKAAKAWETEFDSMIRERREAENL